MRTSNQLARGARLLPRPAGVAISILTALVVACGGSNPPSPSASVAPTPVITPDPHLTEPVTADRIFIALGAAKLGITANTASDGTGDSGVVKQIDAEIGDWPLRITQYSSSAVLRRTLAWKPGEAPGVEEAPYNIVGENILIEYGPIGARAPSAPDSKRQQLAAQIIGVLDPLLWPLTQRSVVVVPSRTPQPTAAPSAPAASAKPARTPKPTAKP